MMPQEAELVESSEVLPDERLLRFAAPWVAAGARPGTYVHVRDRAGPWPTLPRVLPVNTVDRTRGTVTLHVPAEHPAGRALASLRPGERIHMSGPFGRGFELDQRSQHLLLAGTSGAMPWLRAMVDEALGTGRRVVVVTSAPGAASVYPSSLLPDEVEYAVATDDGSLGHHGPLVDLVGAHEAWADQCFAAGPLALLADLATLARGRDARLGVARLGRKGRARSDPPGSAAARRRSWLQVLPDHALGCALGTCLGCAIAGAREALRVCRDGPAFAPDELAWPEPV